MTSEELDFWERCVVAAIGCGAFAEDAGARAARAVELRREIIDGAPAGPIAFDSDDLQKAEILITESPAEECTDCTHANYPRWPEQIDELCCGEISGLPQVPNKGRLDNCPGFKRAEKGSGDE